MAASILIFPQLLSFSAANVNWEDYDKPPLTIIYPEKETLSNPPFIHWQGVKDADHYIVKIKGESGEWTFKTTYNFYIPEKGFETGSYSVELFAVDKDGKKIAGKSKNEFDIRKPDPGLNYNFNELSFKKGRKFRPSETEINEIRNATGIQENFRKMLLDIANAPDPEDVRNLTEPPLYKDGIWELEQWKTKNEAGYTIREYLLVQSLAYILTGDNSHLEKAESFINRIAAWDSRGGTSVFENDHSAQAILYAMSISYNLIGDKLRPETRELMSSHIKQRARDMYGFLNPFVPKHTSAGLMNDPYNNHPWFCSEALGFGGMALLGETEEAEEWLAFVAQLHYGLFLPMGGSSGEWHEGIGYWSYSLYFVFQFCDALDAATGIDLYQHPWLKNTAFFKIYCHPPKGSYVPFGDCKNRPASEFDKLIMMRLASRHNDALAWKYVDSIPKNILPGYVYDALLWSGGSEKKGEDSSDIPFAYNFKDIGWVVSNNNVFEPDNRILFAFRSGEVFGMGGHAHGDQNHFIIAAGDDKLVWDAGYYIYHGTDHHKQYSSTGLAHNTILIDGEGQKGFNHEADGQITKYRLNGRNLLVQGDASDRDIYNGRVRTFLRTINYRDEKYFDIKDKIALIKRGRISWLLHSVYPIEYNQKSGEIIIKGDKYQLTGKFKTSEKVEAIITDKFPVAPCQPRPEQYHLELKTLDSIINWSPELELHLSEIPK